MQTILVVEDEANVRKLVTVNLATRGYRILEAKNGEQALAHLHQQKPALMVLDIKLPDLTGWDILNQMNSDSSLNVGFPVLVMTASLVDAHADLDQYPSVVEILIKPFKTDKLIAAVHNALDQK
jgi:DNA-binding response OmpR family regulator